MKGYLGIFLSLALCAPAMALIDGGKTTLVCGSVACSNAFPFTGIDNLSVGGHLYDVTFSNTTLSSPFAFSAYAAGPGQAATAVDAANALNSFMGTQTFGSSPFDPSGPVGSFITAYKPVSNGVYDILAASAFFGYSPTPTRVAPFTGDSIIGSVSISQEGIYKDPCQYSSCTVWTAVNTTSAPELEPASIAGALTLLLGGIAVMRGARRTTDALSRRSL